MKAGLIGEKLGHSFSKPIHESIADYTYSLIPLSRQEFPAFMEKRDFDAINVTIPYKEAVIPYCDYIDEKAKQIGAVNAIKKVDGRLYATNTDFDGLKWMIEKRFDLVDSTVAILGSGGTSKTAYAVCKALGAKRIIQVARNRQAPYITYGQFENCTDADYIINTTSVGMYPDIMSAVIDMSHFPHCKGVVDVVYNPLTTSLCLAAKQMGIPYICGLEMLVGQAVSAVEFFTGKTVDHSVIERITADLYKSKQNLVLIGMPGCGKTTLGTVLAEKLGMDFADMDAEIEKNAGMTIPQIFKRYGEQYFRTLETKTALELAKHSHTVISCGGGVVKNSTNMHALALNGLVVYIDRDTKKLAAGGNRPLSSDQKAIEKLYGERHSLYKKYSDITVDNNTDIDTATEKLTEVWNENSCY
ncbi:MAG: shikimate 5-dehydrogenase [Oscillospiraceae bacterium]|nr:shikimate 5-dehydrogenase [Oscillospiraceae bacterium]